MSWPEIETYTKLSFDNLENDLNNFFEKYKRVLRNLGATNLEEIDKYLANIKILTEDSKDLYTQYFYEDPGLDSDKIKLLDKKIEPGLAILSDPYLSENNEFWLTSGLGFLGEDLCHHDLIGTYKQGAGKLLFMIMKEFDKEFSDFGVYLTVSSRDPLWGIKDNSVDLFGAEFMLIPKKLFEKFPDIIKNNIPKDFSKKEFSDYIALADMKLWKIEPWLE